MLDAPLVSVIVMATTANHPTTTSAKASSGFRISL
jgi:hypothetical protein